MAETPISDRAVLATRPTLRVDGEEHDTVRDLLLGLEMTEREGGMSSLELRFSNVASGPSAGARLAFEDDRVLRLGAEIGVWAGDERTPYEIFRGKVSALEAEFARERPPELVVLAEDAFQAARMARRTRVWEDTSIADVAREVASAAGLSPTIDGFADTAGLQVQWNESDLAFLRRLLVAYDGDLQVVGDELHVAPREDVRRGEIEVLLSGQIRELTVCADLADQVTEVTVAGWNDAQGQRVRAAGSGSNLGPGRGRTGAAMLPDAFGDRSEHVGHVAVVDAVEAEAIANAAFDRRARRFLRARAIVDGHPAIRVGTHLALREVSPRFDNSYYVTECCHRFDLEQGYVTEVHAESAYLGEGG